jgi:hypothetical protein
MRSPARVPCRPRCLRRSADQCHWAEFVAGRDDRHRSSHLRSRAILCEGGYVRTGDSRKFHPVPRMPRL